jgi:hypothetical protein
MPQGVEHVETALRLIQSTADGIGGLGGVEEGWRTEAVARLTSNAELLRTTMDRFFLKSKLCLPFAGRCEQEAGKLDALLSELRVRPAADGQQRLNAALEALEKAAKTLDERSRMQGMAIT